MANKLYGSVNSESKRVTDLYGSVSTSRTTWIVRIIENNPTLSYMTFNNKYINTFGYMYEQPVSLSVRAVGQNFKSVFLNFEDGSMLLFSYGGAYQNQGITWGFNSEPIDGTVLAIHGSPIYSGSSKIINKLYASVDGETKLVYQGFGHIDYT